MAEDARLQAVTALAQGMAAARSPQECWRAAAAGALRALDADFAALSVWERDLGRLRVLVNVGQRAEGEEEFPEDETYPVHRFPEIAEFLHERWAGGGEPSAWLESVARPEDERAVYRNPGAPPAAGRAEALSRRGRGCCVVAPVVLRGRAWGELYVARMLGRPYFEPVDASFATVLASVAAAGIAQTERLEEAHRLAYTDSLTGLANRRAVDTRLDEAVEEHRTTGAVVSLVVCDLNGLKKVNDTQGHAVGDRLLERFGSVLSLCGAMLPGALAARLGGDEFCLLAVGPSAAEVLRVATELCRRAGELGVGEGVSCGLASTGDPIGEVRSARRLFRLADAAQYRAKAARLAEPVVAGRSGLMAEPALAGVLPGGPGAGTTDPQDAVIRLADAPAPPKGERRRIRGRALPGAAPGRSDVAREEG